MIRKATITGALIATVAMAALSPSGISRIASSAHNFEHYFQNLKIGNSLNPVERFVVSLVLANAQPADSKKTTALEPHS